MKTILMRKAKIDSLRSWRALELPDWELQSPGFVNAVLSRRCEGRFRTGASTVSIAMPVAPVLVTAVAGIAYGFSSLLDLVQNRVSINGSILY